MKKTLVTAMIIGSLVLPIGARAQTKPAAAPPVNPNPLTQAMRDGWNEAKGNVRKSADVMPEAKFTFKPVDTVRTFGAILAHVAGATYEFCAAAKGEKSPHTEDEFEKSATTRAAIVKALDDSIAYCDGVFKTMDDKKAMEIVPGAFGGPPAPRASALMGNTNHFNEHYGNLVTYMRINGLVPPSSVPRR